MAIVYLVATRPVPVLKRVGEVALCRWQICPGEDVLKRSLSMSDDYAGDVKRYVASADDKVIDNIVKHLGIALRSKDASLVSCSSKDELARVRDSWLKKKLEMGDDDAALDKLVKDVCEQMKGDQRKMRVTFYYLLAEKSGKLSALA